MSNIAPIVVKITLSAFWAIVCGSVVTTIMMAPFVLSSKFPDGTVGTLTYISVVKGISDFGLAITLAMFSILCLSKLRTNKISR
jgi:hypothetical protein